MPPRARVALEPAYLLHQRAWRDSSRIIEFLTREHGLVVLFAKGVRRPGGRLAAVLQPFVPLYLSWSGSGDGGTLTGAEPEASATALSAARVLGGFYLNELLLRLLAREDPHPRIYAAYRQALAGLAEHAGGARALRLFEKQLLEALGFGVDYGHLAGSGAPLARDEYYHVIAEQGVVGSCRAQAPEAYLGAELLSLAHEELADAASLASARRLLQAALVGPLDGRELSSPGVARALRAQRTGRGDPRP